MLSVARWIITQARESIPTLVDSSREYMTRIMRNILEFHLTSYIGGLRIFTRLWKIRKREITQKAHNMENYIKHLKVFGFI